MIVEITGKAGAGKSTLSRAVTTHSHLTDDSGVIARTMKRNFTPSRLAFLFPSTLRRRLLGRMYHTLVYPGARRRLESRHPSLTEQLLTSIRRRRNISEQRRDKLYSWTLQALVLTRQYRQLSDPDTAYVVEEGPVHRAITLYAGYGEEVDRDGAIDYFGHLQPPNLLVILNAPNEVCIRRMRQRSRGMPERLRGASDREITRFLDAADAVIELAADHFEPRGSRIIRLNTHTRSVDELCDQLNRATHQLRSRTESPGTEQPSSSSSTTESSLSPVLKA